VRIPARAHFVELRSRVMEAGIRCAPAGTLETAAERSAQQLRQLPEGCQRLINPHVYKVSLSAGLNRLRLSLIDEVKQRFHAGHPA
jgi:nicotinate phosphoribosyltransferase